MRSVASGVRSNGCDRFNPRILLFWYYGLRGLSLVIVPFTQFDVVSLSIFSIFYGLDWVATGPATFALTNQLFGRRDTPVIISWIFAAHQIGGALAAFGAGAVRSFTGDYLLAFMTSGLACLLASLLVLRVTRPAPAMAPVSPTSSGEFRSFSRRCRVARRPIRENATCLERKRAASGVAWRCSCGLVSASLDRAPGSTQLLHRSPDFQRFVDYGISHTSLDRRSIPRSQR